MGKIVVVTGVNMREASRFFKNTDTEDIVELDGARYKLNAAAGTAIELSRSGHLVCMVGGNSANLKLISEFLMPPGTQHDTVNLLDKDSIGRFVEKVEKIADENELEVHLVHYGGVSECKVKMPGDTIFLEPWVTPPEAIPEIIEANTVTWLLLLQGMKRLFDRQRRSKVIMISAIAAMRTGRLHGLDAIQKAACHAMARTLAVDLTKQNIFVTEVMPGMTDTGFYDTEGTLNAVLETAEEYGYEYSEDTFPLFSSRKVGQAVSFALDTDAHVRELSLIPYGQWPHLGA